MKILNLFKIVPLMCLCLLFTNAYARGELQGKTLYVSVDPTNPPFATLENDFVTPKGLDVDIIMELKRRLGFEIKDNRIYPLLRSDQLQLVKSGNLDILGGCVSAIPERDVYMDFTSIYYDTGLSFLYKKGKFSNATKVADFEGAKIGVVNGTVGVPFLDKRMPNNEREVFPNFMTGILAVANGSVDAFVYDKPIIDYFARTVPSFELEVLNREYEKEFCQIALGLKNNSPYKDIISREIEAMMNDGTLDRFIKQYRK